jgi:hypothetical protein
MEVAQGVTERGKVTHVQSRNRNVDYFQDREAVFNATKEIYQKQCIEAATPDMQCQQI